MAVSRTAVASKNCFFRAGDSFFIYTLKAPRQGW